MKNLFFLPYFIYVSILFILLIVLSFPITLILLALPENIKDRGMFWLMKMISNIWFILIGMIPRNYHRRKINFSESYIIAPNHQSFIDAATIYTSIPHVFKTLGKIEIEKAPIYGVIYKTVVITVDRSSMTAKAASFRKMRKELDKGNSLVIFPEGTFPNSASNQLLPFQDGCFSLAILQKVNILPILFLDTAHRLHPSKLLQFTPGLNRAVYLPPIRCHHVEKDKLEILKNYTHQYMQACLNYCRENNPQSVWEFALLWQNNNQL